MVYMFLAEGFEEIEALSVVDILRRGGVEIETVSITDDRIVNGAHGITVFADIISKDAKDCECVILPGGLPGTTNLAASKEVEQKVRETFEKGGIIAAICAAPSVFYGYGILNGKKATSYPGYEEEMPLCNHTGAKVEVDGNIVTSKGAGTAHLFGFKLLEMLKGGEISEKIKNAMQY